MAPSYHFCLVGLNLPRILSNTWLHKWLYKEINRPMNRSINKSNEISQGYRATHGHMGGTWQRTSPGWDQVISNLTIMHLCFEIDECWVWNWQKFQIMLMRIFFDVQGDYRKIGDVILKNLNQNTMEHYGRWTFETEMCSKAFFCYSISFYFYAAKNLESQCRYIDTHGVVLDKLEQTIHKSSKFEQV